MKKTYSTPEFELVRFSLTDAILNSDPEGSIGEVIGGDEGGDLDLDGLE